MTNEILAAVLSFIIPGVGQAYAGNVKKAAIFFVIAIVIWIIASVIFKHWIVLAVDVVYSLFVACDAYVMAND